MGRLNRARWILAGASALLLAAYAAAGFFLVPHIARSQIEASVAEVLQRRIAIGEIRFNPFTLAATLTDLKLTEADGAPLASFRSLYVNAEISSLWRRGVVFKEIDLDAPDIEVIVAPDGSLNLARLAPPATWCDPRRSRSPSRARWRLRGRSTADPGIARAPAIARARAPPRPGAPD